MMTSQSHNTTGTMKIAKKNNIWIIRNTYSLLIIHESNETVSNEKEVYEQSIG